MAKAAIKGIVTRVVEKERQGNLTHPPRVFYRPDNPADLSKLDGQYKTASGEIPVVVDDLGAYEVGQEVEFEVGE